MKFVAWALPQTNSVSFVLSDGPGGSAANIDYKVITFDKGVLISESAPFRSGEYYRAIVTYDCSAFYNEHSNDEFVILTGTCKDQRQLAR